MTKHELKRLQCAANMIDSVVATLEPRAKPDAFDCKDRAAFLASLDVETLRGLATVLRGVGR